MAARLARLGKELERLANDPGPGVSAWPVNDSMNNLEAQIDGPDDSPFANSTYSLSVEIPDRYPFEPPRVRFLTPIYHPNIDSDGRICLDTLKMQPQGSWSPSMNINTVLLTIRILMGSPNADDGLVPDITEEYKRDRNLWWRKAAEHAQLNASNKTLIQNAASNTATNSSSSLNTEGQSGTGKIHAAGSIGHKGAAETSGSSSNEKMTEKKVSTASTSESSSDSDEEYEDDDDSCVNSDCEAQPVKKQRV
jgi:ubiquitin-conjugating enzyme E2 T